MPSSYRYKRGRSQTSVDNYVANLERDRSQPVLWWRCDVCPHRDGSYYGKNIQTCQNSHAPWELVRWEQYSQGCLIVYLPSFVIATSQSSLFEEFNEIKAWNNTTFIPRGPLWLSLYSCFLSIATFYRTL